MIDMLEKETLMFIWQLIILCGTSDDLADKIRT